MDELLKDFLTETTEHIERAESQILQFEKEPTNATLVAGIFRLVHTIKGTSSFLGLDRLQRVAHAAETVIGELRDGAAPTAATISLVLSAIDRIKFILAQVEQLGAEPEGDDADILGALEHSPASAASVTQLHTESVSAESQTNMTKPQPQHGEPKAPADGESAKAATGQREGSGEKTTETIRVTVATIESIMQLVSELVLTRNQLVELTRRHDNETIKGPLQRLSSLTTDLQDAVMRARMQPVGRLYTSLPRLVRELSSELGKKYTLLTEGADTEIDRQLIDVIRDPLTHLIRNCADHGIELPDVRIAAGKPEAGEIRVVAGQEAGQITIAISDDGRGLDIDRIRDKIISKGLAGAADVDAMSEGDVFKYIFEPGFSTAERVSNVSGRGVGMDVVRSNIETIGGTVSVSSKRGRGTVFNLRIPLTLAIAPALIIEAGTQRFALPQHAVIEVVGIDAESPHRLEKVQNALILKIRDDVIPAVELSSVLGLAPTERDDRLAVVLKVGISQFAIIVDKVADVQEIVVKPLSSSLAHLRVFSGRTILGDGSVVLILDASGIARRIGIEQSSERKREAARASNGGVRASKLVLFRAGRGALKALPLSVISRIETVQAEQINIVDGRTVVMRQSRLMPVVDLGSDAWSEPSATRFLLVIGSEADAVALLVDEVVDIVEDVLTMQIDGADSGCLGSAEIRGQPVEVVNVSYYLRHASAASSPRDYVGRVLLVSGQDSFHDLLRPQLSAVGFAALSTVPTSSIEDIDSDSHDLAAAIIDLDQDIAARRASLSLAAQLGIADGQLIGLHTPSLRRDPGGPWPHAAQKILKGDRDSLHAALLRGVAFAAEQPHQRKGQAA